MTLDNFLKSLNESTDDIKVDHPGVLELPDGGFLKSGVDHYKKLIDKKGRAEVMRALCNLERWNKESHPDIASHARSIINKLEEK